MTSCDVGLNTIWRYVAGRSEGVPSEKGINLDAEAVLKFAKAHPRYCTELFYEFTE